MDDPVFVAIDCASEATQLLVKTGVLPTIRERDGGGIVLAARAQLQRVETLSVSPFEWGVGSQLQDTLFAPAVSMPLGRWTCLVEAARDSAVAGGYEDLWAQLLPLWVEAEQKIPLIDGAFWQELNVGRYRAYTLLPSVSEFAKRSRALHQRLASSRSAIFARSASYMGSKTVLSGQLLDVMDALEPPNCTVIDLMCGSGAMSGAFSKRYRTVASDAQSFCRLLGLVQGGGMNLARATGVANQVVSVAREHYEQLPEKLQSRIATEDQLLNSELTDLLRDQFIEDLKSRARDWREGDLGGLDNVSKAQRAGSMFSHLYAGLYFGDRQAAEVDCLRRAIEGIENEMDRKWALGALVCATSSCAFTYGGHFAQPKLDIGPEGARRGSIEDAVRQRTLSVTHEFYVRLTSLAEESEMCANPVELVTGPWEFALEEAAQRCSGPVCVYVDPPYTRDEYSRYYHVLETLVRYESQGVSGKGRLPARDTPGRFASALSGRTKDRMEVEIAKVLAGCLRKGWNCLWSYSDSGTASIQRVLTHLGASASKAEVFHMEHTYKAQGKNKAKPVREYAIHLRSAAR